MSTIEKKLNNTAETLRRTYDEILIQLRKSAENAEIVLEGFNDLKFRITINTLTSLDERRPPPLHGATGASAVTSRVTSQPG